MKKILFHLGLLLLPVLLNAQSSFRETIMKADSLYKAENFKASAETYEQAFTIKEGNASAHYNTACSWALAGQAEKAMTYLEQSVDKGWTNLKWMQKDSDLNSLHQLEAWKNLVKKLEGIIAELEKNMNKPLKKELEEIYVEDQKYRRMIDSIEQNFGRKSKEMTDHWKLIQQVDSVNEMRVIEIIDEFGWPGTSLVGRQANSAVWLVIQHAPLETQEKYLPLLQESVKKGESRGSNLALLEDRILMRNGKPQKYGSQVTTDKATGKRHFHEIMDPANVNKRREEVGLGPIEEYARRFGFEYEVPEQ
ncbi:MAG: tetratricopeptide repeat protein [Bacteroidota bacterium]